MSEQDFLIVGRIRKAHGIRGEVVVEPITDAPDAIFAAGRRVFAGTVAGDLPPAAPELVVESARPFNDGFLVRFASIADRTAAELWRDRYLLLPESEVAGPAEGEAYLHELVGMRVESAAGAPLGEVTELYELPQGPAVEMRHAGGTALIPLRPEFLRSIDRAGRRLVVELPEGFLE